MFQITVVDFFDQASYSREQITIALLCPLNRWATKKKWSERLGRTVDDNDLFKNPNWLVEHFIENGSAEEFAKRRPEFLRKREIKVQVPDPDPEFVI